MKYAELDTPALLIDREILMGNIERMQRYADAQGVALRPHTKTHKAPYIAKLQAEVGARGVAVAKVGEAEVMAEAGLNDILIANEPVGRMKLQRIAHLSAGMRVSFGVDSIFQIEEAEAVFGPMDQVAEVFVEVEVGERRCGVDAEEDLSPLIEAIGRCPHVRLRGLFGHDGNTYGAKDMGECERISQGAQRKLARFAELAAKRGMPPEVVSYGSTPPLVRSVPIERGVTEIRPGTYALMDASQGNAQGTLAMCAATVLATVVSRPTPGRVILDVGAKGLTMQERTVGICNSRGKGFIVGHPGAVISRMFDEHAIIEDEAFYGAVAVGDKVRIIPVHICPTCNLYDRATLISGDDALQEIEIAARGKLR